MLLWTNTTRPDLSYMISKLSEKMQDPSEEDVALLNEVIARAKLNEKLGIAVRKMQDMQLALFTDASNFLKSDVPCHIGVFIAFVDMAPVQKRDLTEAAELKTQSTQWVTATPLRWISRKPVSRCKASSDAELLAAAIGTNYALSAKLL